MIGASRLSFATGEDLEELLGCPIGSASILGLMNDTEHRVTLAMDRTVAESEWFGCHPCRNTSSLRIATKDILETFLNTEYDGMFHDGSLNLIREAEEYKMNDNVWQEEPRKISTGPLADAEIFDRSKG